MRKVILFELSDVIKVGDAGYHQLVGLNALFNKEIAIPF